MREIQYAGQNPEYGTGFCNGHFAGVTPIYHGSKADPITGKYTSLVEFTEPCVIHVRWWNGMKSAKRQVRNKVYFCATSEQMEAAANAARLEQWNAAWSDAAQLKKQARSFAIEQVGYVMSSGFSQSQAWKILTEAKPKRTTAAALWGVMMCGRGWLPDVVERSYIQLMPRFIARPAHQNRTQLITQYFGVPAVGIPSNESIIGLELFFKGAILAMKFYYQNQCVL
jgi:hypothetical protein